MNNQNKIKLYIADNNTASIEEIEVDRISETSYWIGDSRFLFKKDWYEAFFTRLQAKDYLITFHSKKIATYEGYIAQHQEILNNLLQ